jgi:tRNA A-37 threonylcarbamoyl transferase component Bud32
MTTATRYLKIDSQRLESYAERNGYQGEGWREALVADLIDASGAMLGERRVDLEGEAFWFFSPKVVVKTIAERSRDDTLFVCGIHAGTSRYAGRRPTGALTSVPGPWEVLPSTRPPPSGAEPISRLLQRAFGGGKATTPPRSAAAGVSEGVMAQALQFAGAAAISSSWTATAAERLAASPAPSGQTVRPPLALGPPPGHPAYRPPAASPPPPSASLRPIIRRAASVSSPSALPLTDPALTETGAAQRRAAESAAQPSVGDQGLRPGVEPTPSVEDKAASIPLIPQAALSNVPAPPASPASPESSALDVGGDSEGAGHGAPHVGPASESPLRVTVGREGHWVPEGAHDDVPESDPWFGWLAAGIEASNPSMRGIMTASSPRSALADRRSDVERRLRALEAELAAQPTDDSLDAELARIGRLCAAAAASELAAPTGEPTPDSVAHAQHLIESSQTSTWRSLPSWVRRALSAATATRDDIVACLEWVEVEVGVPVPEWFKDLEPGPGDQLVDVLASAWRTRQERRAILDELPPGASAEPFLAGSAGDVATVLEFVRRWRPLLHADALCELAESVRWSDLSAWEQDILPTIQVADLDDDTLELLREQRALASARRVLKLVRPVASGAESRGRPQPGPAPVPFPTPAKLGFLHAVTTEMGKVVAARIVVPRDTPDDGLALVRVPIRLRTTTPFSADQPIFVRADHFKSMHATRIDEHTALGSGPGIRTLQVSVLFSTVDWYRSTGDVPTWLLDVILTIPAFKITTAAWCAAKADLRLTLATDAEFGDSVRLEFPEVALLGSPASFPLSDTTGAEEMRRAPLGIQEKHQSLAATVRKATKSFYVAAPRRFGKTTLFHYLTAEASSQPDLLVVATKLERNESPTESTKRLLHDIEAQLRTTLDAAASVQVGEDGLLKPDTFLALRRIVKKHGKRAVVVFIDEAQTLVPRADGGRWGNHLKTTLEGSAAATDLAGLVFVLVGTTSLQERLGRNCADMLNVGAVESRLSDSSLAAFLREVAGDSLQSSAGARMELARSAGNLWTLLRLLEIIAESVYGEGRAFFLVPDVRRAVDRLVDGESDKHDGNLWSYLSAELSHQDEWDPIDAYPVALGWAAIPAEPQENREQRCAQWINEQLAGALKFPATVTTERVRSGLEDLKRLGVLRADAAFERPLLGRLLTRRAQVHPFAHARDEQALSRLTVDLVTWPANAVAKGEGGQAAVYVVDDGRKAEAWRRADVHDTEVRRSFIRMCAAIRKLTTRETRQAGDEHLPRIRKAGLNIDDANQGIIVYDWIQGERLDGLMAGLPELARLDVARQVALAVASLAARNVVHRDVSPRNVLVDGKLHATLIDLGMASPADAVGTTIVADSTVTAPEVRSGDRATFASDVFALGAFLIQPPSVKAANSQVQALWAKVTAAAPERRPEAKEVAREIEAILERSGYKAALVPGQQKVSDVVARADGWLFELLMEPSFHEAAVHRAAGFTRWSEDRALEVSRILDSIFVGWIQHGETEEAAALRAANWKEGRPSFARVRYAAEGQARKSFQRWLAPSVVAVGTLRNAFAHPADRAPHLARLRKEYQYSPAEAVVRFKGWEEDVASRLEEAIGAGGVVRDFIRLFTAA